VVFGSDIVNIELMYLSRLSVYHWHSLGKKDPRFLVDQGRLASAIDVDVDVVCMTDFLETRMRPLHCRVYSCARGDITLSTDHSRLR
jgi:hypothetical protein